MDTPVATVVDSDRVFASAPESTPPAVPTAEVLQDYRLAVRSRIMSEVSMREAHSGRAQFAIPGDGKEIAQVALAHEVQPGDWRCGYYRDQTLLLATDMLTVRSYFANIYADSSTVREAGGGRQMANHYATRLLDDSYRHFNVLNRPHSAADLSPISSHLAKALGLALASKLFRMEDTFAQWSAEFTNAGNEIVLATIGNGGTSEGIFWEVMNAAGVLQVPLLMSVWDDGMAISVPNDLQTTKGSISELMSGFKADGHSGIEVYVAKGDDYLGLRRVYGEAAARVRSTHVPALVHVAEMTQPLGHSSSGSHERYKTRERLRFEEARDPIRAMAHWIVSTGLSDSGSLQAVERDEREMVERERARAFRDSQSLAIEAGTQLGTLLDRIEASKQASFKADLSRVLTTEPVRLHAAMRIARGAVIATRRDVSDAANDLRRWVHAQLDAGRRRYGSHLYSESAESPLQVPVVPPAYSSDSPLVDASALLRTCFEENLARDPRIVVRGEDVGVLGDVNLVFQGLQARFGVNRVTDTGIREATILGEGIGLALRGFRPIVDIQYLDYITYALQLATDDLATLHHRTAGGQKAPVIIRTKGHRLLGMWHAGSPMGLLLNSLRGMFILVPRNATQAAGMYNVVLRGDNPAIVIEVLNAYHLKERLPANIREFTVPLGTAEVLRSGNDLTIVTYGACCRIALEAAELLGEIGISSEVIDLQTLSPLDLDRRCVRSIRKTGTLMILDEDVPGAASAFILQRLLDDGAIDYLDVPPVAVTAAEHRTPFGADGDYFTKPSREDVVDAAYLLMRERYGDRFPSVGPGIDG